MADENYSEWRQSPSWPNIEVTRTGRVRDITTKGEFGLRIDSEIGAPSIVEFFSDGVIVTAHLPNLIREAFTPVVPQGVQLVDVASAHPDILPDLVEEYMEELGEEIIAIEEAP